MSLVCPSCDQVPPGDAAAGTTCAACGARLVVVTATDPLIGAVLDGRFELRERLGAGAMGVVYRATQLSIGRDVAVKVLARIDNVDLVKRFFREAKIASALSHPNTVQIIEFGQGADGRVYLAMELVRGRTLHDELKAGAMASRRICRIGTQICDALDAAHRMSIVHRDLKLENIMISDDGSDHVKILDFGIARVLGDASAQVTSAGLAAGTPSYMAPEVLGHAVDPAPPQDMYALGVILGELALGDAMWPAMPLETLYAEKMRNVAPDRVATRFRPLVKKLMDLEPAARPSASETRRLLRELDRAATDPAGVAQTMQLAPLDTSNVSLDVVPLDQHQQTAKSAPPLEASSGGPPSIDLELATSSLDQRTSSRDNAGVSPDVLEMGAPLGTKPSAELASLAAAGELRLEVDGAWQAERAARTAGRAPQRSHAAQRYVAEHGTVAKRSGTGGLIIVLLVLAGAVGGVIYYTTMRKQPNASHRDAPAARERATNAKPRAERAAGDKTGDRGNARAAQPAQQTAASAAIERGPTDRTNVDAVATPTAIAREPEPERGVSIRIVGPPGTEVTIDGSRAGKVPISLKRSASKQPMVIRAGDVTKRLVPDHSQTVDMTAAP